MHAMSGLNVENSGRLMNSDCNEIVCKMYNEPYKDSMRSGDNCAALENLHETMFMTSMTPTDHHPDKNSLLEVSKSLEVKGNESEILQAPQFDSMENYKRHGRAILSIEQAQNIFQLKPKPFQKERTRAGNLAKMYGISVKTVRDIWVGRTWYRATFHLDRLNPLSPERLQKKAGRPKGAKDSKPRMRKNPYDISDCFYDGLFGVQNCEPDCPKPSDSDDPIQCKLKTSLEFQSWLDFPMESFDAGFEDPFREDWELWLQHKIQNQESEVETADEWQGNAEWSSDSEDC
jgi:hypothetical protein